MTHDPSIMARSYTSYSPGLKVDPVLPGLKPGSSRSQSQEFVFYVNVVFNLSLGFTSF